MSKGIKVYCKTIDKWFKNITTAARFAKANDWTMSKKMETAGSFIDKEGREYIRQKPMNTKNKYENTGKTIKRSNKKNKEQFFPMIDEILKKPEKKIMFGDYPIVIQNLIEEHAKDMLKKGTPFAEVKSFLLKAGCEKITIKLIED